MPITPTNALKGRQHPGDFILLAVRWYLQYSLAYLHISEILSERGLSVDASCIWMGTDICAGAGQALPPAPENHKQKLPCRRNLHKGQRQRPLPISANRLTGQTIDFLLTAKRDTEAAKRFFHKVFAAQENQRHAS